MAYSNIRSGLYQSYVNTGLGITTSYPNAKDFNKPTNTAWAHVDILSAGSRPVTLGTSGEDEHRGILRIQLNYPTGSGEYAAFLASDTLRAFYKAGNNIIYSGTVVTYTSVSILTPELVDGWYRLTVQVRWRAQFTR